MQSPGESSDSSEEVRHRALPIADLPRNFDPSKAPTSAEEYLHHVMWEAKQYKDVVTVEIDEKRIKQQPVVVRPNIKAGCSTSFLPSADSQQQLLKDFMRTKTEVDRLRSAANRPKPPVKLPTDENPDHWCQFCYGSTYHREIVKKQQKQTNSCVPSAASAVKAPPPASLPQQPLMSILLSIKQPTLENLMEWNVKWLDLCGFSDHQGKWLYCLLTCLEKPLVPELCDNVRQMVFLCARDRAKLESIDHPHLPQLNLIITIITRYFNQDDLADPR